MYIHVVMLRFDGTVDAAYHQRLHEFADAFRTYPGVVSYDYCENVVDRPGAYSHAIVGVFDAVENYMNYVETPLHDEIKAFSMDKVTDISISDFDTGARPVGSDAARERHAALRSALAGLSDTFYAELWPDEAGVR
jgi:hypothetical protein